MRVAGVQDGTVLLEAPGVNRDTTLMEVSLQQDKENESHKGSQWI